MAFPVFRGFSGNSGLFGKYRDPPFTSLGGGGNLGHYRFMSLFLDAYEIIICP